MINFDRLAKHVGAVPFRPFRVTTTSGKTFDIRHPEMIHVGRTTMIIYTFMNEEHDKTTERQVEVSLLLTESVEPIDSATRLQGV